MIDIKTKSRVNIHWNVSPYDYNKEREKSIISKFSKKYNLPKEKIKVIPEFLMIDENGEKISLNTNVIENIQNPEFQLKLFETYLKNNNISGYDFELIKKIDAEINGKIDYKVYDKYRRYSIKWIRWNNFLSYGSNNYFDFTNIHGLTSLSGDNQAGKTTLSIDLIHFLLFGKTEKVATQDKIFNKHLPKETSVSVEGCINIDGVDYIIKRTLSRPSLERRSEKSKTIQKVEYYKIVGDSKQELEEYDIENQQEENGIQTNKAIKDAIGIESDFDLIMSVTESTLDDLVNKKEADRGRLLSRWIGLLPIEEKDKLAREKFNSEVKPMLLSNRYNEESLMQEIEAFELTTKNLNEEIKKLTKDNKDLDKEIDTLEKNKTTLLSSKIAVDQSILKVDITTLNNTIQESIFNGKKKNEEIELINKELKEIGEVEFSIEEYDKAQSDLTNVSNDIAVIGERYKNIDHNITHLKSSEICPTCHRKLDNVDNSQRIAELTKELETIVKEGKEKRELQSKLNKQIEKLKTNRELFNKRTNLTVKKAALEVNVEKLRNEYKENLALKKEYEKNSEAIDKNNAIDIQIRNNDVFIRDKRNTKETNSSYIARDEANIKTYKKEIEDRKEVIKKLNEEEKLLKNWKIYLELVGKNGISKMVLRKTLPIINAKLSQLLHDICDFDVEVMINQKNDVMFYLIKDGIYSDLASGSGFELTASGIALRAVLSELSTIPRSSILTYDEIWGRVAKANYDNMKTLIEKVAKQYDAVFLISHSDEVRDWCDCHVSVKKENNISKVVLK
jgi:DNA repair exonuclease SbcCD ATPase subunit